MLQMVMLIVVQVHNGHPWTDQHGYPVQRKVLPDIIPSILWQLSKTIMLTGPVRLWSIGTFLHPSQGEPSAPEDSGP